MKAVILHDRIDDQSRPDVADALVQADLVTAALTSAGYEVALLPVDANLAALQEALTAQAPDVAINLVESLNGVARLGHVVPALLEVLGIPFTGTGSAALQITTSKLLTKCWLERCGIPTPSCFVPQRPSAQMETPSIAPGKFIIKPVWEDASVGIDDQAVVAVNDRHDLDLALDRAAACFGEVFAEEFIEGREFNLAIYAGAKGPVLLPPAEIEFVDFPAEKPHIVGYAAKWDETAFEYHATPRRFGFPATDDGLLQNLRDLALQCWHAFQLHGYARVDFRVDCDNRPFVLEVNANPCISPDAGFMAAVQYAGLQAAEVVMEFVRDALSRSTRKAVIC
ncbi:MAG: D-alanine--D-alanine ligase [Phycisphaerae bacterium]